MFDITPNAIITIGFEVKDPYIRNNFEYVVVDGKEEPVHELMGLKFFGTREVKHISKITRDNRIENLIGPNGETHTRAEYGMVEKSPKRKKRSTIKKTVVITMSNGEELEYNSIEEVVRELGLSRNSVRSALKHGSQHANGWKAKYEVQEKEK